MAISSASVDGLLTLTESAAVGCRVLRLGDVARHQPD